MSEPIKHECGIAMIRLLKPFSHYINNYGTPFYALNKLYVMMEKQSNRGQDGAGVGVIKMDVDPGNRYISRYRSIEENPTQAIFQKIRKRTKKALKDHKDKLHDPIWLKENVPFIGEALLGHLRYGTHGNNTQEACHPFLRQNNWRSRNLVLAGNFNMTNVDQQFNKLLELGQHPKEKADTVTVLEKIGHFLDEENQMLFDKFKYRFSNNEISDILENAIDLQRVLKRACKDFDGGYAMAGITGYGATFVARDPAGIRPAYYYANEEIVVTASEKNAINAAFGVDFDEIKEVTPGHALIIDKEGLYNEYPFTDPLVKKSCSFERIYFSRGSDPAIYKERKMLGKLLVNQILDEVNHNIENSVFSYIPNTAETSYIGMMAGLDEYLVNYRKNRLKEGKLSNAELDKVLSLKVRTEKVVIKDVKLRTFITDDSQRDGMVSQVYGTTKNIINKGKDTIIVIDDSIVRGTTLEKSILRTLDALGPKKIVIVSSAPQIRYPDCYGIDMSKMKEFVAFRAILELIKENGMENLLDEVYEKAKVAVKKPIEEADVNYVKEIYAPFSYQEVSNKIAEIITPSDLNAEVSVIYQTVENLHKAIPDHLGDWYFTGDYPTTGGNRVVNQAFINFMEGKLVRAY